MEIIAGILLSLAGAATSWSGYQSTLWGGIETESYSRATASRLEYAMNTGEAGQMRILDAEIFGQWLNAHALGRTELEKFYRSRFRSEFIPAFDAWIDSKPLENPKAEPTPFTQPEYKSAFLDEASDMKEKADNTFKEAQKANFRSDSYVLNTVIFGVSMFFAGIAQQFDNLNIRKVLLIVSTLMIVIGIYNLCIYPVALPG